jgi:hypothetical protein
MFPARRAWRRDVVLLLALTLLTSAAWVAIVPPFEGTDELYFYNRSRDFAAAPERRENVFFRLAAPIVLTLSPAASRAAPEYNPAFAFVGNGRGQVNRFAHDRPVAPREHVRTLTAIRALVVVLGVATIVAIYAIARLSTGAAGVALLVACLSLWVPQFSFINAVVHAEAVTRLFAALVTLAIVAYATGALSRRAAWVLLPLAIATVPFADRQALFVAPFAALALVATERRARDKAIAAALVVIPVAVAGWIIVKHTEVGTDLAGWTVLLLHPLRPFISGDPSRGSVPPTFAYYMAEFFPKMFMGFWGWLGQPSILLPAWLYAALAVLTTLAAAGLVIRLREPRPANDDERRRLHARRLMAAGIVLMWIPIVYGPAVMGLNLWYGRWLFPMLGPIMIGFVLGLGAFGRVALARPHRTAAIVGLTAMCLGVIWLTSAGETLRAAIQANHYGDRERLIETVADYGLILGAVAATIEIIARIGSARIGSIARPSMGIAAAGVANMVLLFGFIRPLYAPLTADEYAGLVAKEVAADDRLRAADLYASAVKSYPRAAVLRSLADATPSLLLGGSSPSSRALLWDRLARGKGLNDRDALLMLAHEVADGQKPPWRNADTFKTALDEAELRPDLAEPAALVRMALDGTASDAGASSTPIEAGGGRRLQAALRNGEVALEGFTVHRTASDKVQVIVYFRPRVNADNRSVWLHTLRVNTTEYQFFSPVLTPSTWTPGTLAWAAFQLPPGTYHAEVGMWEGSDLGTGVRIGIIP